MQIGLDDFGTGYVSLVHLRRLPLSYVKIDRKLVRSTSNDPGGEQVLAAVIGIAADLGLRSIAEGVEKPAQLDRLRELGCDEAQGDLFGLAGGRRGSPQRLVDKRSAWDRISRCYARCSFAGASPRRARCPRRPT